MSHSHNKIYRCSCGWKGFWPNVIKSESKEGDLTVIKYVAYYPDCDYEFTLKEHAK